MNRQTFIRLLNTTRKAAVLGMAAFALTLGLWVTPTTTHADVVVPNTGCNSITNPPEQGTLVESTSYLVGFTPTYTVPSGSSCNDINIAKFKQDGSESCTDFRVRFYPSSGGSFTNSYKNVCYSTTLKPIATDVLDGTKFRVEFKTPNVFPQPSYTFVIWD